MPGLRFSARTLVVVSFENRRIAGLAPKEKCGFRSMSVLDELFENLRFNIHYAAAIIKPSSFIASAPLVC
jgi:hypothetical protein